MLNYVPALVTSCKPKRSTPKNPGHYKSYLSNYITSSKNLVKFAYYSRIFQNLLAIPENDVTRETISSIGLPFPAHATTCLYGQSG